YSMLVQDPQGFLLSGEGNWLGGLALGGLFIYWIVKEKQKNKSAKPKNVIETIWPHTQLGNVLVYAAVFGLLGAKIFHNLEYWDEFMADPVAGIFSFSGLTFYGGLICGGAAVLYITSKYGVKPAHMLDVRSEERRVGEGGGSGGWGAGGERKAGD